MRLRSLAAAAALSLIAAQGAVAASPAMPPAPQAQRVGEATGDANALVGTTAWILAAIALGLIIWGIIEITDDDDGPTSP